LPAFSGRRSGHLSAAARLDAWQALSYSNWDAIGNALRFARPRYDVEGADQQIDRQSSQEVGVAPDQQQRVRADARENRERILRVAHDVFAESGDASLNSIAKKAGVGPGTLYRHFPTRAALILAVYQSDVQGLVESVPSVLATHPPLVALRLWFEWLAAYVKIKHGLGNALNTAAAQRIVNDTYEPVTTAIGELLQACQDEGSVRSGLDPADVLLMAGCLWRVEPGEDGKAQAERLLDLIIHSLRP
jgi:AcrR family transcriptional regulator